MRENYKHQKIGDKMDEKLKKLQGAKQLKDGEHISIPRLSNAIFEDKIALDHWNAIERRILELPSGRRKFIK